MCECTPTVSYAKLLRCQLAVCLDPYTVAALPTFAFIASGDCFVFLPFYNSVANFALLVLIGQNIFICVALNLIIY